MAVDIQYIVDHPNDTYWMLHEYCHPRPLNRIKRSIDEVHNLPLYVMLKHVFSENLHIHIPRPVCLWGGIDKKTNLRQPIIFRSNVPDVYNSYEIRYFKSRHETLWDMYRTDEEVYREAKFNNQYNSQYGFTVKNDIFDNCHNFCVITTCFLHSMKELYESQRPS